MGRLKKLFVFLKKNDKEITVGSKINNLIMQDLFKTSVRKVLQ